MFHGQAQHIQCNLVSQTVGQYQGNAAWTKLLVEHPIKSVGGLESVQDVPVEVEQFPAEQGTSPFTDRQSPSTRQPLEGGLDQERSPDGLPSGRTKGVPKGIFPETANEDGMSLRV